MFPLVGFFHGTPGNMAMPNYRCTAFFQDPTYQVGWSETYFLGSSDHLTCATTFATYIPTRVALMMDTSFIVAIRICDVSSARDSLMTPVPASAGQGTYNHSSVPFAGVDSCLLVRLEEGIDFSAFNKKFLHSVPANIFNGRIYLSTSAPSPWPANFSTYQAWLLNSANNVLVRKKISGVYNYTAIGQVSGERWSSRKLGRPFGTLVGKRAIA